ncbi:MAG: NAD(+) diphosphatase [Kineosporiaceae bacterium]
MSRALPPLAELALSRTLLDRAAHRREEPLPDLLADPATATVVIAAGHALVVDVASAFPLAVLAPQAALAAARAVAPESEVLPVLLGEDPSGRTFVGLLVPAAVAPLPAPEEPGLRWAGLREAGEAWDAVEVAAVTAGVALAAWHAAHPRCAACGEPTRVASAGWTRACPACGRSHFPRTDPAVIMAVCDEEDRLLLGRQASWPEGRWSTLAGFVEPGESLETAVRREVAEECGVVVGEVTYQGSQPWPFPCSLMLGFSGVATTTVIRVDGVELAGAGWWTRERLAADVADGTVSLPPGLSIARRLIEQWFGGPIAASRESWR